VGGSDQFAAVAPGIGKRIVAVWRFQIESESDGVSGKVSANKGLLGFSVFIAMD
jgi:hypothetical protein